MSGILEGGECAGYLVLINLPHDALHGLCVVGMVVELVQEKPGVYLGGSSCGYCCCSRRLGTAVGSTATVRAKSCSCG